MKRGIDVSSKQSSFDKVLKKLTYRVLVTDENYSNGFNKAS
jgi:hypothetical protein